MNFDRPPVRVLAVINQLGAGGAERLLISAVRRHDPACFVFEAAYVLQWNNALVGELEGCGVPVHCLGVGTALDLRWAWRLKNLIDSGRFRIVHVHSPFVAAVTRLLIRTLRPHRRPRLLVTAHASWHSYSPLTKMATALTLPLDDLHIAVSEDSRRSMPGWLRKRVRVVVQGVPIDELAALRTRREEVRRELQISDDQLLVITVANLVREKNYPDLLKAAKIVSESGVPVRFVAVGGGPLDAHLRQLHQSLGLERTFEFIGFRPDAVRLLSGADLFALASSYEGYPVAVMEALAVGVPVVATAVGGIPDAIEDGVHGFVVQPNRPDLLAAAIIKLCLDGPLRRSMAEAAALRSSDFDIRRTVEILESVYCEVLGK